MAAERLDERAQEGLRGLLAVGDPAGEVAAAHNAKECLRELYTLRASPDLAASWLNALIADLASHPTPELRGMTRTLRRWRRQILAWHTTGSPTAPPKASSP
jgi:transposase